MASFQSWHNGCSSASLHSGKLGRARVIRKMTVFSIKVEALIAALLETGIQARFGLRDESETPLSSPAYFDQEIPNSFLIW